MLDFRKTLAPLAGILATLILGALSPAQAADKGRLNEIIAAAKKEGRLNIVHSRGTMGGPSSGLREGFNKYYGLNIDVEFTPAPQMGRFVQQIIQQVKSNRTPVTDLLVGYPVHMFAAAKAGAIVDGHWKDWAPNIQNSDLTAADGAAVKFQTTMMGIAYNTNALKNKDVPRSFHDLMRASLKGRVATTPYAAGFDLLGSKDLWGKDKTIAFAKDLSAHLGGLIRCNEIARVASGEFDAFALTCDQTSAFSIAAKGGPVGWVPASDAPILWYLYEAVPTNAAHPNAAMLWANYMLSREAQDILYKVELADLNLLEGSHTGKQIRGFEDQGVKFLPIDVKFFRANEGANLPAVQGAAIKTFRSR